MPKYYFKYLISALPFKRKPQTPVRIEKGSLMLQEALFVIARQKLPGNF